MSTPFSIVHLFSYFSYFFIFFGLFIVHTVEALISGSVYLISILIVVIPVSNIFLYFSNYSIIFTIDRHFTDSGINVKSAVRSRKATFKWKNSLIFQKHCQIATE